MFRLIKDGFTEIYLFLMDLVGFEKFAIYTSCFIIALLQMLNIFSALLIIQHIVRVGVFVYFFSMKKYVLLLFLILYAIDYLIIYPAERTIEEEAGPLAIRSVIIPYGVLSVAGFVVFYVLYRH